MSKNPTHIFHGGCLGCSMQDKKGLGYCAGCQYFKADWSLPNLNDKHAREEEVLNEARRHGEFIAARKSSRLSNKQMVIMIVVVIVAYLLLKALVLK